MANEELQRRSRRMRLFWIIAGIVVVGAIGFGMVPDPVEVDLVQVDRGMCARKWSTKVGRGCMTCMSSARL